MFVSAVDRWIVQETSPRQQIRERTAGPTLFDFGDPPELKMETMTPNIDRLSETTGARSEFDPAKNIDVERSVDNITRELERLLEENAHPQRVSGGEKDG